MAATIALEIITPDGPKLKEAVDELTAPSVDGEFGVLPMHRPLLAALATGIVTFIQNGKSQSVAVGPGFVEIVSDKAVLLTDRFIRKDDIDAVRTRGGGGSPCSSNWAAAQSSRSTSSAYSALFGSPL